MCYNCYYALVVKLVDTADSKSAALKGVRVQVPPEAPNKSIFKENIFI